MAPSTFASAAAGIPQSQNPARDAASEWARRTNGATQTFRRPSGAASIPSASQQSDSLAQQPPRYVPPHRNGAVPDTRYSKDQLLDLFKAQQGTDGGLSDGLPGLLMSGWQQDIANGTSSWARSEHTRDPQPGLDVCWEKEGSVEPLGLVEMDEEERELFFTSVNTPIKPPASSSKESQSTNGLLGRKVSISGSITSAAGYGLPSPSVARGAGRRREASESYPFPQNSVASPGGYHREDQRAASPPPSLLRRRTDLKDLNKLEDRDKDADEKAANPFGSLKRHPTGPLGGNFAAPSSPWSTGPQSAGLAPMGSFGSFGIGSQPGAGEEKRAGVGGGRAESRFKNLLSKETGEEARTLEGKTSTSSLSRAHDNESWRKQERADDPLDEEDEDLPIGSAALAADAEASPPHPRAGYRGFGTPSRQGTADEYGFSAFGMTSDASHGFGHGFGHGRDAFHQSPAHQRVAGGNEPMSPTDTNPYQSPEQHGVDRNAEDIEGEGSELHHGALPGLGGYGVENAQQLGGLGGLGGLPNLGRAPGPQGPAGDRSETSSVGPNRGFPSLGGLGQLGPVGGSGAWPVSQGGLGTPGRQTAGLSGAFGGGIFANNMGDLQSPSLAGLGGSTFNQPTGSYGGSRMASMFPPAMQDQMRPNDPRAIGRDANDERAPGQPFGGLGDINRGAESPFTGQDFGDAQTSQSQSGQSEESQSAQYGAPGQHAQKGSQHEQGPVGPPLQSQQAQQLGGPASNQPPAPQQRTMVMPDRMRWIYRDPQGQTQGPWSGLEMHDWYKAGFFSPELLVKKYEDPEYEPLAQLIRRIGNSREPFLVPQIGIPHGAPSNNGPNGWAGAGTAGSAQPPFASSFPSFGTTLTAEQQNALERRKQEEQYLMARQKEHLAQAQIAHRMQMQTGHGSYMPGQLHHHSSAQSLQSQPSFGSMTSPSGYQPSPIQGPTSSHAPSHSQGFFDNSFRQQPSAGLGAVGAGVDSLGHIREEEIPGIMDRLNLGARTGAGQYGAPGQPFSGQQQTQPSGQESHTQRVQQMMQDRAQLQQEQAEHDAAQSKQPEDSITDERLQQFKDLQAEAGIPKIDTRFQPLLEKASELSTAQQLQAQDALAALSSTDPAVTQIQEQLRPQEALTLTEQVQKAASAKHSPAPQQPGLPHPFPPAPSQSPLPAPAAQRAGRQTVADQLQTESRELSQTPSVETPSAAVAPWAKEPAEAPRGPSLKEIQEAEAKKAAEAEEVAAAARRAAFQKEMEVQAQAAIAQPGLPAGATWATGSPATPTGSVPAAWAKTTQKPTGQSAAKSMAQIQKEEEARKKKLAAAAAAAVSAQASVIGAVASPAGGKSYANLAGKVSSTPVASNTSSGAWTTVGAGGKAKTPLAAPAAASRTVSASIVPTLQPAGVAVRKPPTRSSTMTAAGGANAQDEFRKWAVNELRPDLNKGIAADDFVASLFFLPAEGDIITEAVHGVSSTIDSRHFAEEFIRRKKLADKGIIDTTAPPKSISPYNGGDGKSGGWSEVAKKGPSKEPAKEEANGNFRVVAAKKKGGKR